MESTKHDVVGYLYAVDSRSYQPMTGGVSDTFVLNITNSDAMRTTHGGGGFLLTRVKCHAEFFAMKPHLFNGFIFAEFLSSHEYNMLISANQTYVLLLASKTRWTVTNGTWIDVYHWGNNKKVTS